jgi:protein-S-isoprenylcysteine O-methyltransferase Ste14
MMAVQLTLRSRVFSQKISRDSRSLFGAAMMAIFAGIAGWRWHNTVSLFFALLVLRDLVLAYGFLTRSRMSVEGGVRARAAAYFSTFLPLLYQVSSSVASKTTVFIVNSFFVVGFLLATLAAIELGSVIGIAPAFRGKIVRTGVYRFFRHPMYTGYLIAELGWVLLNPINLLIFVASICLIFYRIRIENRILQLSPSS